MSAFDLGSARHWARRMMVERLREGDVAVDATMGNGHDTQFLCEQVGEGGRVYAFDVQAQALDQTRERLARAGLIARATLIHAGHENLLAHVAEPIDLAVFNLGWLPGGDKAVTTRLDTTLAALRASFQLLKPGGLLCVCAYPGHGEGERERAAVQQWARAMPAREAQTLSIGYLNQPENTPALIAVHKR